MAGTLTETVTCPKCEADVRPGSAFCYNCGGPIAGDEAAAAGPQPEAEASEAMPEAKESLPAPGLRTARDIRRRERTFERKPRQVAWEPASGSDIQLIVIAAVVLAFTVVIIGLALYLK
jgi:hypothetical protein